MSTKLTKSLLAAFLLMILNGQLVAQFKLFNFESKQNSSRYGAAIAALGDLNFDGFPEFAIANTQGLVEVRSSREGGLLFSIQGLASDNFGACVAGVGDINGDSWPDFAVGAPKISSTGSGYLEVYSGVDASLIRRYAGLALADEFGSAILGLGDVNGDGRGDLAVGATGFSLPYSNCGSVVVLDGSSGAILSQRDGSTVSERLGQSLVALGDWDKDGVEDFAVGGPGGNSPHNPALGIYNGTGHVLVCSGRTGNVLQFINGVSPYDQFGAALTSLGDLNADGIAELAIGAPGSDVAGVDVGQVRILDARWQTVIKDLDGPVSARSFGGGLAGPIDFDGDGVADFIAGAPDMTNALPQDGGAYLVNWYQNTLTKLQAGSGIYGRMGASQHLAVLGDLNGDGFGEYLLADPAAPSGGVFRGRVEGFSPRVHLGPAATSRVYGPTANQVDVLKVAGSTGGTRRVVDLGVSKAFTVSMDKPPLVFPSLAFAIYGALAVPDYQSAIQVPLGIGAMAITPCPMYPAGYPILFTLTNNFVADPCGQLVGMPPAPSSVLDSDGIPFAIDFCLQGVMVLPGGIFVATNAILVRVT